MIPTRRDEEVILLGTEGGLYTIWWRPSRGSVILNVFGMEANKVGDKANFPGWGKFKEETPGALRLLTTVDIGEN